MYYWKDHHNLMIFVFYEIFFERDSWQTSNAIRNLVDHFLQNNPNWKESNISHHQDCYKNVYSCMSFIWKISFDFPSNFHILGICIITFTYISIFCCYATEHFCEVHWYEKLNSFMWISVHYWVHSWMAKFTYETTQKALCFN